MITLDANEVLVVYKQDKGTIERRIVHGPMLFAPTANEWLHEFKWHGEDPKNKAHIIPQAKVFTKLRIVPQQFYYNVPEASPYCCLFFCLLCNSAHTVVRHSFLMSASSSFLLE